MNHLKFRQPASSARWLEQNNSEQIISQRPLSLRVCCGALAFCIACVAVTILPSSPDRIAAPAAITVALMLVSLTLCLLLGTGPNRLYLDLRRQQYSLKQGMLGLTWTRCGQIGEGELYVVCTRSRQYQIRFRAQHWKYGLPIEALKTETEARLLAQEIAERLQVSVRLKPGG